MSLRRANRGTRRRCGARARTGFVLAMTLAMTIGLAGCSGSSSTATTVSVFAAASLSDVVHDLDAAFTEATGIAVTPNFASSNALAQQIRASSSADVFLSANEQWVDYLEEQGRLVENSRRRILSNRLAIVVHQDSDLPIQTPQDLAKAPFRFLSIGDPQAVPAGRYAREWLESVTVDGRSLWDIVETRHAPAPDVRAALATVEGDRDIVGIVYRTDATISDRVRTVYEVPMDEGPRISYVAARVADGPFGEGAERYLEFLTSPAARAIFESHGFLDGGDDSAAE